MSSVLKRAWSAYNALLISRPVLAPAISTGVLMGSGDLLAQAIERHRASERGAGGKPALDLRRTGRLFALGCCVYGPWLNAWYKFLARRFQSQRFGLAKMVAADQLFMAPCFIGAYMTVVTYLHTGGDTSLVAAQLQKFPEVLLNNYKVWPAVQTVNFMLVPVHLRLMLANCVALLWNTYMSWVTHHQPGDGDTSAEH